MPIKTAFAALLIGAAATATTFPARAEEPASEPATTAPAARGSAAIDVKEKDLKDLKEIEKRLDLKELGKRIEQSDLAHKFDVKELDRRLKFIEADNGRYAPERKGLPLDIDVLLYGEQVGNFNGLVLPRAEILKNAFVLWPLALLAPQLQHPVDGRSFAELWASAQIDQQLWPAAFQWRGVELTPAALLRTRSS